MKCSVPLLFYGKYRPIFILSNGYGERRGKNGVPEDAEEAMRAECRQHGRTTPPGSSGPCWRQKRGARSWKESPAGPYGRRLRREGRNSTWVAYAVQHLGTNVAFSALAGLSTFARVQWRVRFVRSSSSWTASTVRASDELYSLTSGSPSFLS
jgi:hypothetical protein